MPCHVMSRNVMPPGRATRRASPSCPCSRAACPWTSRASSSREGERRHTYRYSRSIDRCAVAEGRRPVQSVRNGVTYRYSWSIARYGRKASSPIRTYVLGHVITSPFHERTPPSSLAICYSDPPRYIPLHTVTYIPLPRRAWRSAGATRPGTYTVTYTVTYIPLPRRAWRSAGAIRPGTYTVTYAVTCTYHYLVELGDLLERLAVRELGLLVAQVRDRAHRLLSEREDLPSHMTVHHVTSHCIALHCIASHRITGHCIALHCTALHCTSLHYMALHCSTVLG